MGRGSRGFAQLLLDLCCPAAALRWHQPVVESFVPLWASLLTRALALANCSHHVLPVQLLVEASQPRGLWGCLGDAPLAC